MPAKKSPTKSKTPPFYGASWAKSPKDADIAIFGAPHGTPYSWVDNRKHAGAANAFRHAMEEDSGYLDHWDYDLGGPLLNGSPCTIVDLGNLPTKSKTGAENRKLIGDQTKAILAAGAVPIMFGGDDSTPIPFIAAYAGEPKTFILQIDAHIDWRDELRGERQGYSSTMRRTSELSHIAGIVQAGMRGIGSARTEEVEAARQWGARIFTSRHIHHHGLTDVLDAIPAGCNCLITMDCDAIDLSLMPAVAYPTPGGLNYTQVTDLIAGVAAKARIAGFTLVEFVPSRDPAGTAAFVAARIAAQVIGQASRQRRKSA